MDRGREFESDLIKHLCSQLGIEKTCTSPYHAQCDGMVERLNRTLKDQLAKYIVKVGVNGINICLKLNWPIIPVFIPALGSLLSFLHMAENHDYLPLSF